MSYDAIIVGARRAGAPTAMLLARQGNQDAMDGLPVEFFVPANVARIFAAAMR